MEQGVVRGSGMTPCGRSNRVLPDGDQINVPGSTFRLGESGSTISSIDTLARSKGFLLYP
jgi:hypothetical protein